MLLRDLHHRALTPPRPSFSCPLSPCPQLPPDVMDLEEDGGAINESPAVIVLMEKAETQWDAVDAALLELAKAQKAALAAAAADDETEKVAFFTAREIGGGITDQVRQLFSLGKPGKEPQAVLTNFPAGGKYHVIEGAFQRRGRWGLVLCEFSGVTPLRCYLKWWFSLQALCMRSLQRGAARCAVVRLSSSSARMHLALTESLMTPAPPQLPVLFCPPPQAPSPPRPSRRRSTTSRRARSPSRASGAGRTTKLLLGAQGGCARAGGCAGERVVPFQPLFMMSAAGKERHGSRVVASAALEEDSMNAAAEWSGGRQTRNAAACRPAGG